MIVTLREYQVASVNAISRCRRGIIKAPAGSGKCLGKGTPVMMFDGSIKPVEQIIAGDLLMGPDSKPRIVKSVTTGREQMFRVTPRKGDPFIVNESHILSMKVSGIHHNEALVVPNSTQRAKNGDIVNICVRDYISASKHLRFRLKAWRAAVDFQPVKLHKDMPAYLLGAWLGDGNSNGPGFTSADPELVTALSWHALLVGLDLRERKEDGKCPMYFLTRGKKAGRRKFNPFLEALRELNVLNNKHVPHAYLTASRADRLDLLAGLLDTDGSMAANGFDFISKNERLADGVCFIARSLGLAAYKNECTKTCCNNGKKGQYFRVSISGDCSIIPCRIPRKRASKRTQPKSVLVTGITLESVGEGEYFGFEIEGPDRLFLLGDFTVTHNTLMAAAAILKWSQSRAKLARRKMRVAWIANTHEQIEQAGRALAAFPEIADLCEITTACYASGLPLAPFDLVILDECHHIASPEYRKMLNFHDGVRWGFSATPHRADDLRDDVFTLIGPIVHEVGRDALVNAGQLAKANVIIHTPNAQNEMETAIKAAALPLYDERKRKWPHLFRSQQDQSEQMGRCVWQVAQQIGIAQNRKRNGRIISLALRHADDSTLIIIGSIEHGEALQQEIPESILVFSKMGKKKRQEAIQAFSEGEIRAMLATSLADEGLDVPRANVLILAAGGRSSAKAEQRTGRVLRAFTDKTHGTIHDFSDVQHYFLRSQSKKRFALYKQLGYSITNEEDLTWA